LCLEPDIEVSVFMIKPTIPLLKMVYIIIAITSSICAEDTLQLSAVDAVRYALRNRPSYAAGIIQQRIANEEVFGAFGAFFPTMSATADFRNAITLATNLVPSGVAGGGAPPGKLIPIKFGTRFSFIPALSISLPIVDPILISGLHSRRIGFKIAEIQVKQTLEDVIIDVARTYFTVVLDSSLLIASRESYEQAESDFTDIMSLLRSGKAVPTDTISSQVQRETVYNDFLRAQKRISVSRAALNASLGKSAGALIRTSESLDSLNPPEISFTDTCEAIENRTDYILSSLQEKLAGATVSEAKSAFFPVLSVYGLVSTQSQNDTLNRLFSKWFGNNYWGIRASVTLIDGLRSINRFRIGQLQLESSQRNIETTENLACADIIQKQAAAIDARNTLFRSMHAIESAAASLEVTKTRLNSGTATINDVITSRTSWYRARAEASQARYDYLIAYLELLKATGKLEIESVSIKTY
jgi:outer membrane protein TolC